MLVRSPRPLSFDSSQAELTRLSSLPFFVPSREKPSNSFDQVFASSPRRPLIILLSWLLTPTETVGRCGRPLERRIDSLVRSSSSPPFLSLLPSPALGLTPPFLLLLLLISGMSLEIVPVGSTFVKILSTGETFTWTKPSSYVRNLVAGTKYVEIIGKMEIVNLNTGDACLLTFKEASWGGSGRNAVS